MFGMEQEVQQLLIRIEGHEALGQLEARDRAINTAVSMSLAIGMTAGYRTVGKPDGSVEDNATYPIPEWAGNIVAYIQLPTGEVSYFLKKDESTWTGYTREEKLKRVNDFIEGKYPDVSATIDAGGVLQ